MNRQEKANIIDTLKNDFMKSQASFIVGYKGTTVAQILNLRRKLHAKGSSFNVAKVTLIKRVARDVPGIEGITPYCKDQIAIVFAENDSPAVAKILCDFAKDNKEISIVAGCMDAKILSKESVMILASLPSKEVLLAQVCGTLKAPMVQLAVVLNMLLIRLVFVLKKIEEQKAQQAQ